MDVKDNVVIREFVNKDGEEQSIKFVIRNGDVEELYVNGNKIPESEFPKYEKESFDIQLDHEKIREDIRKAMEEVSINTKDMREEMMKAMEEIELLDQEKMQKLIDEQMLAMENINFDKELKKINELINEIEKLELEQK